MEIVCTSCGHMNVLGTVFCKSCGEKISENALRKAVAKRDKDAIKVKASSVASKLVFFVIALGIPAAALVPAALPQIDCLPAGEAAKTAKNFRALKRQLEAGARKKISITPEKINTIASQLLRKHSENSEGKFDLSEIGVKLTGDKKIAIQAKTKLFGVLPAYVEQHGTFTYSDGALVMNGSSSMLGYIPIPGIAWSHIATMLNENVQQFPEIVAVLSYIQDIDVTSNKIKLTLKKSFKTNFNNLMLPGEKKKAAEAEASTGHH